MINKVSMFRVEKENGEGPYTSEEGNPAFEHMFAVHGDDDHLEPWDDPMLGEIYPDEVCGFPTLCALEEWFSGYEDVLEEHGYGIAAYTVTLQDVRYGKKQCVFMKRDRPPVRFMSLN